MSNTLHPESGRFSIEAAVEVHFPKTNPLFDAVVAKIEEKIETRIKMARQRAIKKVGVKSIAAAFAAVAEEIPAAESRKGVPARKSEEKEEN